MHRIDLSSPLLCMFVLYIPNKYAVVICSLTLNCSLVFKVSLVLGSLLYCKEYIHLVELVSFQKTWNYIKIVLSICVIDSWVCCSAYIWMITVQSKHLNTTNWHVLLDWEFIRLVGFVWCRCHTDGYCRLGRNIIIFYETGEHIYGLDSLKN